MKIITKAPFRTVGLKVVAPFNELHSKIPQAWKKLSARLNEITHRKEDVMTELSMKVEGGIYTELVGTEVVGNGKVPEGMTEVFTPGQTYIHYRHTDSLKEIANSFGTMYDWAEDHGHIAGDFKIDYGYSVHGSEDPHDLYIKIQQ